MNNQPDTSARMADGVCPGPDQTSSLFMPGRRSVIKAGVGGLLGLMLADALQTAGAQPQKGSSKSGKPKACILLWMNGGPSHLDTWDPKPGAVTGGPFKAIKTRAADMPICEHLPQVADVADKIAIVRSMTSKEGNHQRAQYLMHTGYTPNPTIVHPSLGAWVTEELADPHFDLPSFVSISGPSYGAGFLGVQYGPLVVQTPGQMPQNVAYATGVTPTRFDKRQEALAMLEGDALSPAKSV